MRRVRELTMTRSRQRQCVYWRGARAEGWRIVDAVKAAGQWSVRRASVGPGYVVDVVVFIAVVRRGRVIHPYGEFVGIRGLFGRRFRWVSVRAG
jgi:hypothetical protein